MACAPMKSELFDKHENKMQNLVNQVAIFASVIIIFGNK